MAKPLIVQQAGETDGLGSDFFSKEAFHVALGLVIVPDSVNQFAILLPELVTLFPSGEGPASEEPMFAAVLAALGLSLRGLGARRVLGVASIGLMRN